MASPKSSPKNQQSPGDKASNPDVPRTMRLLNRDGTFNSFHAGTGRIDRADLYHSLLAMDWTSFLGLVFLSYLLTNLLFAAAYYALGPQALSGIGSESRLVRFADCLFFSVHTLSTIGYGHISPLSLSANLLVTCEALLSLFSFALVTGLLYARVARPTARILFSDVALVSPHDGIPSLIFRMANLRANQIVEAQISVQLSRIETTREGERYRTFHDLSLERSRTPILALSWTVVHPITRESPMYGATPGSLAESESEILVSLTGIDDLFSQTVHARFSYTPDEILWNRMFEDILYRLPDGRICLALEKVHLLKEPT